MAMASKTRRELLRDSGQFALAATGIASLASVASAFEGDYGPFRMGIQSYTLRAFGFDDALAITKKLGLHYWQSFQAHIGQTADPAKQKEILSKLKDAGVKLTSWGVHGFDADEAKARAVFDFAKAMNLEVISADPAPSSFDLLDKLVEEYKISIAIHNHGPGARYDKLPSVANAVKDRHPRIGACVDTGHTLRSSEDPVEWVKALGPRVLDMHLKDVKGTNTFTEVGKGDLRTADIFRELRRIKFKGVVSLEYEEHEKDPAPYVEECLAATRLAIKESLKSR